MITRAQLRRLLRLPFSHAGRNFLWWTLVDRGQRWCHRAARLHRATLARRKRVIMVVGTYGKTTTTRAVAAVLGLPVDRWLDYNANCLGLVAWSLLRQPPWRRHAAIEVGIGEPDTMRIHARTLRPQVVVVACIASEHQQSFRDREHLRNEKADAVRSLGAEGVAVLNADDPNVLWMATQTRARVIRYGFDPTAEVRAMAWSPDGLGGTTFTLAVGGEEFVVRSRLLGRPAVSTLLAAVAVAVAEDVAPAEAVERLARLAPTPSRLESVALPGGGVVLCDDYKSSLETVHAAIDLLAECEARRRVIVLGGLDSPPAPQRVAYREVAAHAGRVADHVILVGHGRDLYRPELKRRLQGPEPLARLDEVERVGDVVRLLEGSLGEGCVVLIKGRTQQHLRRVLLALQGRKIGCAVDGCRLHLQFCDDCPLLEKPGRVGGIRQDDRIVETPLERIEETAGAELPGL